MSVFLKILPVFVIVPFAMVAQAPLAAASATTAVGALVERLHESLSGSNIFAAGVEFRVSCLADDVLVSSYRDPRAKERDMRVESLLVASRVFAGFPRFKQVHVYFFDRQDQSLYWTASVARPEIENLKIGRRSAGEAVRTVQLQRCRLPNPLRRYRQQSYHQIVEGLAAGPMLADRAELVQRINRLAESGSRVSRARELYLMLEDAIRTDDLARARSLKKKLLRQLVKEQGAAP